MLSASISTFRLGSPVKVNCSPAVIFFSCRDSSGPGRMGNDNLEPGIVDRGIYLKLAGLSNGHFNRRCKPLVVSEVLYNSFPYDDTPQVDTPRETAMR